MNKLTRIGALSMLLVAAVAGAALATPRSTGIQDLNTLHRSIGSLWNSSHTLEAGLTTGALTLEKGRMAPGADHPRGAGSPGSHHLQSDDTKLYPPADLTCNLSPAFAAGSTLTLLDRETA
jgi:hypothetical protein